MQKKYVLLFLITCALITPAHAWKNWSNRTKIAVAITAPLVLIAGSWLAYRYARMKGWLPKKITPVRTIVVASYDQENKKEKGATGYVKKKSVIITNYVRGASEVYMAKLNNNSNYIAYIPWRIGYDFERSMREGILYQALKGDTFTAPERKIRRIFIFEDGELVGCSVFDAVLQQVGNRQVGYIHCLRAIAPDIAQQLIDYIEKEFSIANNHCTFDIKCKIPRTSAEKEPSTISTFGFSILTPVDGNGKFPIYTKQIKGTSSK